jgi:hypothetical protein
MIFAEKLLIVRIFLRPPRQRRPPRPPVPSQEMGGMVLMLGVLLWLASSNPVRNVAIVVQRDTVALRRA